MSSAVPAIPLFGDAYLADTRHLSLEEHGAYLQLIMIAWRTEGCRLPDDDARLARMLGVTAARWRKLKPTVMAFWTLEDGTWKQARLSKERAYVESRRQSQRDKASAKWETSPEAQDDLSAARKRAARLTEARKKGRHTEEEWQRLVALTGNQCVKCHSRGSTLVKDHILPIYRGGSDALSNLQPLCISCNSSKSADDTDFRLSACFDLFERLPNACPTPAPPPPPLKKEGSVSNDTDGDAVDPIKELFDAGVALLTATGSTEKQARSLIGKWRKSRSDGDVMTGLIECRARAISEPIEWLEKRFAGVKHVSASGYEYRGSDSEIMREAERRADWGTYWAVKAGSGQEPRPPPDRRSRRRGGAKPIGQAARAVMEGIG